MMISPIALSVPCWAGWRRVRLLAMMLVAMTANLALAVTANVTAKASDRFAVIVYAQTYHNDMHTVSGAAADADTLTAAMRAGGYEVRLFANASAGEIRQAAYWLAENLDAAGDGAYGVFYFIGHAAQLDERAYLLGVDAVPTDTLSLAASAAPADDIAALMGAANARSMVVLDVTTAHGPARRLGLAPGVGAIEPPGNGTLVLSAPPNIAMARRKLEDGPSAFAMAFSEMIQADMGARSAISAMSVRVRRARGGLPVWVYQRPANRLRFPSQAGGTGELSPNARLEGTALVATNRGLTGSANAPEFSADLGERVLLARLNRTVRRSGRNTALATGTPSAGPPGEGQGTTRSQPGQLTLGVAAIEQWQHQLDSLGPTDRILIVVPGQGHDLETAAVIGQRLHRELGFDGPVLPFSWPSLREQSPLAYQRGQLLADRSGADLAALITELKATGDVSLTVVADGLGGRVLAGALAILAQNPASTPSGDEPRPVLPVPLLSKVNRVATPTPNAQPRPSPPIRSAIFVTPDADPDRFLALLEDGRSATSRLSVYVSPTDPVLARAASWNASAPTAGSQIFIPPTQLDIAVIGVEVRPPQNTPTIAQPAVLGDLAEAIVADTPAALRGLEPGEAALPDASGLLGGSTVWRLRAGP